MKINILRLIEDALIGGRNGENAYIENNPLMAHLFREYRNKTRGDFKSFLMECLKNEEVHDKKNVDYKYDEIKKTYSLNNHIKEFKEYKELESNIRKLENEKNVKLKEIATILNPQLVDISTYEIKYREYGQDLQFKINVSLIENLE